MNAERRLIVLRKAAFLGVVGQIKSAGLGGALFKIIKPGNGFFDAFSDQGVVLGKLSPRCVVLGQYRLRHASDNGGFTTHSEADWFQFAVRCVHDAHGVFHRHKLVAIFFTTAEAG